MPNPDIKLLRDELARLIGENRRHKRVEEEMGRKIIELTLKVDLLASILKDVEKGRIEADKISQFYYTHTPPSQRTITQTLCVADIRATVVTALLDLRVDATLPRMRALLRLTQGMRIVKYRFDGEWEFSAGRVHFTAKEVRECITLE